MSPAEPRPAAFLDRDGVLNELVFYADTQAWEGPRYPGELRLVPGAAETVAGLRRAGWPVFLVSNQPNFAKGKTSLEAVHAVHQALLARLAEAGAALDGAYYCFHHPEGQIPGYAGPCLCRKPSPYLLQEAAREHGLDLPRSWMVGDQDTDVLCGRNAGCRTILVSCDGSRSRRGSETADACCMQLTDLPVIMGRPMDNRNPCEEPPR